ncbi:hypothetical protein R6Q57_019984 [Mikania cordata]
MQMFKPPEIESKVVRLQSTKTHQSEMVFCWCGKVAIVRTSWTDKNPGRRFYLCPDKGSNCRFIRWLDPVICDRSMVIIPGLLKSKNEVETNLQSSEAANGQLKKYLIISWIGFFCLVDCYENLKGLVCILVIPCNQIRRWI